MGVILVYKTPQRTIIKKECERFITKISEVPIGKTGNQKKTKLW